MIAKLFVLLGAPLQRSGGDRPAPSHVYFRGMGFPYAKAGLVRRSWVAPADAAAKSPATHAARNPQQMPRMEHSTDLPAVPARRRPTEQRSRVILAALVVALTGGTAWSGDASPTAVRQ